VEFWHRYLTVMQSLLPRAQQLTDMEKEVLSLSIAESSKDGRDVFHPTIVKILAQKLGCTEYTIRMHRKNIRNKGWIHDNVLEGLSAKVAQASPEEVELTIRISHGGAL